jgi:hypothetical protein
MIKYVINHSCGSDLLMGWVNLFLAYQHFNSETNLRECEDQSWFTVQAVPYDVYEHPRLKTAYLDRMGPNGCRGANSEGLIRMCNQMEVV